MNAPKEKRNKEIVGLRDRDPKTFTFALLGLKYGIAQETVIEIYYREKAKGQSKRAKGLAIIKNKYPNLAN